MSGIYARTIYDSKDYMARNPDVLENVLLLLDILQEEEGIMLEAKAIKLLADRIKSAGKSPYSAYVKAGKAVRYAKVSYYVDEVQGLESWFPEVIRLPGNTRTKPKSKYLGEGLD